MTDPTKCCELSIVLNSGTRITGSFLVPLGTDSSIRPADAIRNNRGEFLLLCDVTVLENGASHSQGAILLRKDAIAYVELPGPSSWAKREIQLQSPDKQHDPAGPASSVCPDAAKPKEFCAVGIAPI